MTAAQEYFRDGKVEGKGEGILIGAIRALQDVLGVRPATDEELDAKPVPELQAMHDQLRAKIFAR
jgi:hypothetical protein